VLTSRQRSGQRAEELAAAFLCRHGLSIVVRNYRCRLGELDIVARERNVLVIAEVRTRAVEDFGGAAASVDRRKQLRLTRAAARLLQQRSELTRLAVRFDVLVVRDPEGPEPQVEWIRHAFAAA
jgi:putative endonuclease